MKSLAPKIVAAAAALALHAMAQAAPLYIQFAGNGAQIELNGTSFSNANWVLELQVESNTPDADLFDTNNGVFPGAITGSWLSVNGNHHQLSVDSVGDTLYLNGYNTYGYVFFQGSTSNSYSYGYLQTDQGLYPELFNDLNNLSTANLGTTVSDINSGYGSEMNLSGSLANGSSFSVYEVSNGSGNYSVTISAVSAVPEPSSMLLASLGLAGLAMARRRERKA